MPQSPRQLALAVLARWELLEIPPRIPERTDPHWAPLDPRDRNFAFDLITGVIRSRALLDTVIASQLKSPLAGLEPTVHAILWIGAFQLLLHRQAHAYAAVSTSVELARHAGVPRSAGLINAVLRAITRLQPAVEIRHDLSPATFPLDFTHHIRLNRPIFPDPAADPREHLATVTSHPRPLVDMLAQHYGEPVATSILIRNNLRPFVILRADDPAFIPPETAGLIPHETPRFFVAHRGWNPAIESLVAAGTLSPQDPTSGKVVELLARHVTAQHAPADRILDLCAGLGTKSIQLARAFPSTSITATDLDAPKLARLAARARDLRLANLTARPLAEAAPASIENGAPTIEHPYPIILIDAPCSNTGVMARRVQSRWRWPTLDHTALCRSQFQLLHQAAALISPGGLILYATCSLDPAENRDLVAAFLSAAPRPLKVLRSELTLPANTDTPAQQHDGGYLALLSA